ncbi:hypothetical protein SUGI_0776120 [Cryptomeria japonica]|uniref:ubiquitin carboxyl-terminal hydrolase 17 n=1 Tax=Cryptomeria japonica TaxID=3369 RepID=UPI002414A560|nr:ubiquitin carboxyl-terminal hydrolase 17 [Cryptomeria japonica]GLJ38124.1 hypothetical protein SUGI_0776120 [Cryptomeria japonica]
MHVFGKIELPGLFSATFAVIQLVFLIIILKWKGSPSSSTEEEEEMRKLVVVPANERSTFEEEYMGNSSMEASSPYYKCAVCYSVAAKRCARCKAVRYCSGKCQILHWRGGHKEECQPLDKCGSSFSIISTQKDKLDLASSFSGSKDLGSPGCNLKGQKVSSSVQNLDNYITEAPDISISNFQQISISYGDREPACNNALDSVPKGSHRSNGGAQDALLGSHTKYSYMPVMPSSEVSAYEVPANCSFHMSNIFSSSEANSKECVDSTINSVKSFSNISVSENPPNDMSLSMLSDGTTDCITNSIISEHDLHSCTNMPHDSSISENHMLDCHINGSPYNNFLNCSNSESNPSTSGIPFHESLSTRSHVMDASRHSASFHGSPGKRPELDGPCWRNFADDSSDSGIPSSVLENCNERLWLSGDDASSSSNDTSAMSTQHELRSSGDSLSKGTFRRSIGTAIQYFSRQKAKAAPPTISSHLNVCNDAILSSTPPTVGSSQNISNGFKRSVKKVLGRAKLSKVSKQTNSRAEEVIVKPSQILFRYEYFVELFNCNTLELYPCGLINCGNSCYANVVLQCLTFTRPLAAYLLQGDHAQCCKRKNWCLMCELEQLILTARQSKSPVSPTRILSRLQRMRSYLGYGRQEDAHELLRLSIEAMQSICLDEAGGEKTVNPTTQKTTFMQQLFGGCLLSKVQCMRCHYESDRFENMLDLTVEIHGNIESLEDALAQFTAPELLDGENKYKCDRCKSYVKAEKRLVVHEAPNILTIVLKRFKNGKFGKLNKHVTFPEFLDMSPFMSGTADEPPLYMLYAVIVHLDMLNASFFGHYVCYVKDLHGTWYKIDDTEVEPVTLDTVMAEGAYMLLYSRSSPRPPYVLKNGITQACMQAPLKHPNNSWQSLTTDGQNKSCKMNAIQFSPLNLRTTRIDEIDSDIVWSSDDYVDDGWFTDIYGFNHENLASATTDWDVHSTSREYTDYTYSETGSLFSGSDEASWSTDSYRDSTSTEGSC